MSAAFEVDASTDPRVVAERLATAFDERRRNVERILHDGVQQHMALLGLKLSMLQKRIGSDPERASVMCEELRDEIQGALRELRAVAHLIYPAILENEGLAAALQHAAHRLEVHANVDVVDDVRLPRGIESAFYFCCLEALDNAARHAGPGIEVDVTVSRVGETAVFEVVDDGAGFEVTDPGVRSGLQHIADRVTALGGSFSLSSSTGGGTRVRGEVPIHELD